MRRLARALLVVFCFAIPWEYSLDWGPPLGNVARVAGLLLLVVAIPAVFEHRNPRRPGLMQWLGLIFLVWICCTCMWTVDPPATFLRTRGYVQELLPLWCIWEFADSPEDLRTLLRASVAGSWVLAMLTIFSLVSVDQAASDQLRFAAYGQDPNDVARFLDLGFPLAALLAGCEKGWMAKLLAWGYLPLGLAAVLLTASRGGFLAALVALTGSAAVLALRRPRAAATGTLALPLLAALLWSTVPRGTFERLATIPEQLRGGDFNLRLNIWHAGWHAFIQAPFFGQGIGAFAAAARLAPIDTAHNTVLSLAVGGGMVAVFLASAIVVAAAVRVLRTRGTLRLALLTSLLSWMVTTTVATVEENRTTWLLLGLIALAGRLAVENPGRLDACFDPTRPAEGAALARAAA